MRASLSATVSVELGWVCSGCRSKLARPSFRTASLYGNRRTISTFNTGTHHPRLDQQPWPSSLELPEKPPPRRDAKLPDGPARTRFAPSPTGYLHIGGLRTALFSYLLAKRTCGQFVLRIEDTDQKRLVPDAESRLREDLLWAGLQWDEGPGTAGPHGPYKQSLRTEIYQKHALELLSAGQAYRCFCTPQAAGDAKAAYVTSGCYQNCSSLSKDQSDEKAVDPTQPFTIRLRQPADAHKRVYPDLVYGKIQRLKRSPSAPLAASEDDAAIDASDTVLVKSDGTPTYHFANVVDDHLMRITHVIRGSEWMASTPLHYDIYTAFGWTPPHFAHVGLLVDQNKAKLSKRNAELALDVASMRDKHGVLPAALVNFLALLGWSNPTNNDVMELDDLVYNFDLKFTRGNAMVRMEKLWFLQKAQVARKCQEAISTGDLEPVAPLVDDLVSEINTRHSGPLLNKGLVKPGASEREAKAAYATAILLADSKSYRNAAQFVERNRYFFTRDPSNVPAEQQYYNPAQTLTAAHLRHIIAPVLESGWKVSDRHRETRRDFAQTLPKLKHPARNRTTTERALDFLELERTLNKRIWTEVERTTLRYDDFPVLCDPAEGRPRLRLMHYFSQPGNLAMVEGASDLPPEGLIDKFSRQSAVLESSDVEWLDRRKKAVHGALMKYLREKLSMGLPGPHMSAVMAILGKEECITRLGIEPVVNARTG